jgi:magnesium transporter
MNSQEKPNPKDDKNNWLPPGSLVYVGSHSDSKVKINIIDYSETFFSELEVQSIEQCKSNTEEQENVTWVDIKGLNDTKTIEAVGKYFGIHRLWLEDVLNTEHQPKAEEVDDLIFIIIKAVRFDEQLRSIEYDQVSLFLGRNFVVSFTENQTDILEPVKTKIRQSKGRIRQAKADYLFYALVDSMVDQYLHVIKILGHKIEDLDTKMNIEVSDKDAHEIRHLKNELIYLRKASIPIRDSIAVISRSETEDITPRTRMYFKDSYEHALQNVTQLDFYREMINGLSEAYNQNMNRKLNEILRVLTVFTTVFSPLTFIAGVYGMNFKNLPELQWENGYYIVWGVMVAIVALMLFVFKKRKWI